MIWFLIFFLLLFSSNKDFLLFSSSFMLSSTNFLLCAICFICLMGVFCASFNSVTNSSLKFFLGSFSSLILTMVLFFSNTNPFLSLVIIELSLMPVFAMAYFYSKDMDKLSSCFFMFCMNILGSIPFMLFASEFLISNAVSYSPFFISFLDLFLMFCFFLIFVMKLPILFFHFWLTKAHVSSSGPVSMFLASLMLKLGSFGLFLFSSFFSAPFFSLMNAFLAFSLISCILICLVMIRFFDTKNLVACSSIGHMSCIFFLPFLGKSVSCFGSIFMMAAHGVVSCVLFFLITFLYEVYHNRTFDFVKASESSMKMFSMILFLFTLLNLGLPPFINFLSEALVCVTLFYFSYSGLFFFSLFMILSIFFTMFILTKMLFGKKVLPSYSISNTYFVCYPLFSFFSSILLVFFI